MKALSVLTVSAIARRNDHVLLIRQRNASSPDQVWDLPGGMVEEGELADEAVLREIWEETGLKADTPSRLLSVVQFRNPEAPPPGMMTAMYFEVEGLSGEISCQDPDGDVLEAEWVPIAEAISRLSALRASHMRDPAIHYLTRPGPGVTFWTWPNGLTQAPHTIPPVTRTGAAGDDFPRYGAQSHQSIHRTWTSRDEQQPLGERTSRRKVERFVDVANRQCCGIPDEGPGGRPARGSG